MAVVEGSWIEEEPCTLLQATSLPYLEGAMGVETLRAYLMMDVCPGKWRLWGCQCVHWLISPNSQSVLHSATGAVRTGAGLQHCCLVHRHPLGCYGRSLEWHTFGTDC